MVDNELADVRRARAVEADAGEVRRVGRQDEVTVRSTVETDDDGGVDAQRQTDRREGNKGRGLGVDQLRNNEQGDSVSPRSGLDDAAQGAFQCIDVSLEEGVCHPRDTEDGEHGGHTGFEDRGRGDLLVVDLAEDEDDGAGDEHDHLDDQVHGQLLQLAVLAREGWAQNVEGAEDDDNGDSGEEDDNGVLGGSREDLTEQRVASRLDGLCELRILHLLLESLVLVEVLAAAQGPQGGEDNTAQRGRHGDHEDLRDGVRDTGNTGVLRDDGGERHRGDGHRRRGNTHLSRRRGDSHRALRANALLQGDVLDDREHGVDDVAGTAEHGEEPRGERGENGDALGVSAQDFLCELHHHF